MSRNRCAALVVVGLALSACASTTTVTQVTLAPVERGRSATSAPSGATAAAGTTTETTAAATVAAAGASAETTQPGAATSPLTSATLAATQPAATPPITIASARAPALTTAAPTTAFPATTVPATTSPVSAAVVSTTCISSAFGSDADPVTIKLVEKALHATQNGDFAKLMSDLRQWVANSRTILETNWRAQGFSPDLGQVDYLTFYALGIVCPTYTFAPGELTDKTAPYKAPVGGCLDHPVPLDASAGGVFPNTDVKVIQQALQEMNRYSASVGGTPGPATMSALYQFLGGGFGPSNPIHQLELDQLTQLEVAC